MSAHQMIDELTRQWKVFPNMEERGKYEYFSQTIELQALTKRHIEAAKRLDDYGARMAVIPLLAHETTHWVDHTSTLWGQNNLVAIYNAVNARLNGDVTEFWRMPLLASELKRIQFPDYYTEFNPDTYDRPWDGHPWQYRFSCGLEFGVDGRLRSDRPILFTQFTNFDAERLCRVPFSVASLLEANAMLNEIAAEMLLLDELDRDTRMVEEAERGREYLKWVYNLPLVAYSVVVHCVANTAGLSGVLDTYPIASALATLALNLPDAAFDRLKTPDLLGPIQERAEQLRLIRDRGFAFVALAQHCAQRPYRHSEFDKWIESGVLAAGLPSLDELQEMAQGQLEGLQEQAIAGPASDRLRALLSAGRKNLAKRGLFGPVARVLEGPTEMQVPPFLLSDDTWIQVGLPVEGLSSEAQRNWLESSHHVAARISEFCDACRL